MKMMAEIYRSLAQFAGFGSFSLIDCSVQVENYLV